ncbi:hypothetical protein BO85DRAFT_467700 [Aspergillus piperis CBS 112811]|uniref:Zn(2)-C6 fungal-type domain-containing protein n=1 Tax=Aspergillus piperis CBS 112811 TaxID=1448313 RepID=A0A8G1R3R2_9EURO|nr:hypothetical protein BO85DRAFT_467700 [Aspergillus piperis CBS 112811]RAH58914.1 hypothetical protein BO85DRAFT_467700 [Aspergillus piperis CBS 112811]
MEGLSNNNSLSTAPQSGNNSSAPSSKRVRVVVSQSKRGCVTCKARRVKCDEQKPLCWRCLQSGRVCGGYSHEAKSSLSSALQPALKCGVTMDSHAERLSYLAAHVLSLDNRGCSPREDSAWGRIFLQLSSQVECVKAAAVAFGAAYESSQINLIGHRPYSTWNYYGSALARLRSDFHDRSVGAESLALASMVLAYVEILSQHEQNAFTHFLGAVQILTQAEQHRWQVSSAKMLSTIKDALVKINLLIGSYGLSQTPQYMYLDFPRVPTGDDEFCEPELAIDAAMHCLYRSYQFIEEASHLRYTYSNWKEHDPTMCKAQSDAAAECRSVLDCLAALVTTLQGRCSSATPTPTPRDLDMLAEIYAIRTQLTSALIFILCAHSPYETSYDEHHDQFQSIISDAAASARLRRRTKPSAFKRFSTRLGIVSPLFIVGIKCRNPSLRSLATALLTEQSREGPADGRILAAIGARLAALETSSSFTPSPSAPLTACDIIEGQRVYGYSVSPRFNMESRRVVDVIFQRPSPPLMQGWGHTDYSCQDGWMYWSEAIEI